MSDKISQFNVIVKWKVNVPKKNDGPMVDLEAKLDIYNWTYFEL